MRRAVSGSDGASVERANAPDGRERFFLAVDDETRDAVVDHFGHRAAPERDHRRAARDGLDHDEPERLGPVDREEQGRRVPEELALAPIIDLPQQTDLVAVDEWLEVLLVVPAIRARYFDMRSGNPAARANLTATPGPLSRVMRPRKAR